jgi:tRNA (guanine37-N1)-methyltransferase
MRIDILTLFPGMFEGVLGESILRIAQGKGLLDVRIHNFREFTFDAHRSVDDKPYGGGAGMVLKPEPIFLCIEKILAESPTRPRMLLLTPQGRTLAQPLANELSREDHLLLVCGHYEGFDERIRLGFPFTEVSIGDFVLTGGELPAMIVMDAVVRLIPGVLGDERSATNESFAEGRLEHPHYTRPPDFRGMKVPEVLLSGHHKNIEEWRRREAERRTHERRPDLLPDSEPKSQDSVDG